MEPIVVGIDLGTTFSAIAYVDEMGTPRVIPNVDGKTGTPSVVWVQDDQIQVGDVALNQWVTNEEHVIRWIKRAMGNNNYAFHGYSPVQLSAEIIKALKADAERELGQVITDAVITCPAYFAAVEIENTRSAGELAGFTVREIVKEPTAAAVYYGVEHMRPGEKILVCDLGGGTYDATLLTYEQGAFLPLASSGDRSLGGHDWTMQLVDIVSQRFWGITGIDPDNDLCAAQMIYEACEQAKRDFSRLTVTIIPCQVGNRIENISITRDEFEQATEGRMQRVVLFSEEALSKANMTWQDVDTILLVGGSSRLRRMSLALEEASGIKPVHSREPDLMVALGAAVLAAGKFRPRRPGPITDVLPGGLVEVEYKRIVARSLGTRVIDLAGSHPRITNSLIIPHSTETPVTRTRDDYEISSNGQEHFDIPVVEFEDDDDFETIDNFRFMCMPDARRGDQIRVTFHYDESGIPTIEAFDLNSNQMLIGERLPYEEPDVEKYEMIRMRPQWVIFAIDTSFSMYGSKMEHARQALSDTIQNLLSLGGENKVGLVSFSTAAEVICHPTDDNAALQQAIQSLQPFGLTAMDDGISLAIDLVMTAPADADRDVVMITDGMPDSNRRDSTRKAALRADELGIKLSSLGIGTEDVDPDFLQSLSPISFVIDESDNLGLAIDNVLTLSQKERGGKLTDR